MSDTLKLMLARLCCNVSKIVTCNIRESSTISIVLMDVDHFKSYNDLYGHLAGDECLRRIAELASTTLHRADFAIGGAA